MSKHNRNSQRSDKGNPSRNDQRRQELEWLYSEENERHLEKLRNGLIFVWLLCSFAFAFLLEDQQSVIVWAGATGVLLVIAYQIRSLWLEKIAEDRVDAKLGRRPED